MHFITSNYNNLSSNTEWNIIKKFAQIDEEYANFFLALNDKKKINNYNVFHINLFLNESNLNEVIKKLKFLKKTVFKNEKKIFFLYFFLKLEKTLIDAKNFINIFYNEIFKLNFSKNKNIYINFNNFGDDEFSYRNLFYLKFPFEIVFLKKKVQTILNNIKICNSKPYKLIILDCDNTLWGGVLDEDKEKGIIYGGDNDGEIFFQFQTRLKKLKEKGFILSIASKNNEENVWKVLKKRKMVLQKKDFIQAKINWNEKYHNIKETLNKLTLRPADTLFIDDNLLEIKKVEEFIPKINTIHIDDNSQILNLLDKDIRLQRVNVLDEDLKKYDQYKIKSEFEELKLKNKDNLSFYKNLRQKISKKNINSANFDRTLQIFNKTNQFNFSLNRYNSKTLLEKTRNKNYLIKLFELKDKFGSHGLIGAYICKFEKNKVIIEDFALSCRVLSRFVEDYIMYDLLSNFPKNIFYINYVKTIKNDKLIKEFLKKTFFVNEKNNKNFYQYQIIKNKELIYAKQIFR